MEGKGGVNKLMADFTKSITEVKESNDHGSMMALSILQHMRKHRGMLGDPVRLWPEAFLNSFVNYVIAH